MLGQLILMLHLTDMQAKLLAYHDILQNIEGAFLSWLRGKP